MAYAVGSEFPHVMSEYPDMGELLYLYKSLNDKYAALLQTIKDTQTQLEQYMADVNSKIPGWIKAEVDKYVNDLEELKKSVSDQLKANNDSVKQLLHETQENVRVQLDNQNSAVFNALNQNVDWVQQQLKAQDQRMATKVTQFENWFHWHSNDFKEQISDSMEKFDEDMKKQLTEQDDKMEQVLLNEHTRFDKMLEVQNQRFDNALESYRADYQKVTDLMAAFERALSELTQETTSRFDQLAQLIESYNTVMRLWYLEHRSRDMAWIRRQLADMREDIANLPESSIPVDNVFKQEQTSINEWMQDLWAALGENDGYSAWEWNQRTWITCDEFNALNVDCTKFYTWAKHVFNDDFAKWHTFSPITGKYVWIGTALQEVADALNPKGVTAKEYDDKGITAQDYDDKNMTARDYYLGGMKDVLETD